MLNRAALFATLQRGIAGAAGQPLGLLILRTQRLHEFELLFGYEAGEAMALAMTRMVRAALRPVDQVIVIGECDFAIVLPGLRGRNHAALAAAKLVRTLQAPIDIGGREAFAAVAVGGAVFPDDGGDSELLCRRADRACAAAASTSERFALYETPALGEGFPHGDLHDAIARNGLDLYLQPIMHLHSGRIARAEALSRWTHPIYGAITPDTFIPVAEQTGLIGGLTRWSFNAALRHVADAHAKGGEFGLSVNISAVVLQQASFADQASALLRFWNLPAASLVLEMTETALMRDPVHSERLLRQLRDQGFGVAIDDFGTGYSSLAYLKRLPVTELKIDKSFIADMSHDARTEKLVAAMIDLSHHLGIEVVAEGVEDAETLERLRRLGCDHVQGYHVGYPAPARDTIAAMLRAQE